MQRYVCVHCHLYQPPRENAWLEAIELQDSAHPYHDWNARITAECYAPNGASRIMNWEGQIEQIVNNYSRISFNFGPTLLAWLETEAPDVYQSILDADRESMELFDGHGSAMAQAYNHMIMPLANRRDKYTQAWWGVQDFRHRFQREPQGMWLPETAVDLESLDILAELGIEFTVLSPYQAKAVRPLNGDDEEWVDVTGGNVDPTMPYLVNLPSGRTIHVFFYDGPISQGVAFEGLLSSGELFAERLMSGFDDARDWPQILHIATDGESYGHHHRHGDMALAYALHSIMEDDSAELINYAAYLARHETTHEAEVYEDSSWSCVHGVERWRSNCGCNSGGHGDWNQEWRAPLRASLDWLRDRLADEYEARASRIFTDPWRARDDFIDVILDRSPENIDSWLDAQIRDDVRSSAEDQILSPADRIEALKLLELQRHAMLMYTSCGWFFDELSGIETVQVIQYAGRAVQLAQEMFGDSIEESFLTHLAKAESNIPEHGDGRNIFKKMVRPAMVNLQEVGAHYAVSSLFHDYGPETDVFCYQAELIDSEKAMSGRSRLHIGQVRMTSRITDEAMDMAFGVAHFGDHNVLGGVRTFQNQDAFSAMKQDLTEYFNRAEFPEVVRVIDRHFQEYNYSIRSLFRDEQRRILNVILDSSLEQAESVYQHLYEDNAPMMHFLADIRAPLPTAFEMTTEFVINHRLQTAFMDSDADLDEIDALLNEVIEWDIELDQEDLAYTLSQTIDQVAIEFSDDPDDLDSLARLNEFVLLANGLPFEVTLWRAQNIYYDILTNQYAEQIASEQDEPEVASWAEQFLELGRHLSLKVD